MTEEETEVNKGKSTQVRARARTELDRLERKVEAVEKLVFAWARDQGIDVEKVIEETETVEGDPK